MSFYQSAGNMALGSRLRQLGDVLLHDAEKLFKLYEVDIDPRWFPVFYMLTIKPSAAITELAQDIGQTHPAVSQVVKSMVKEKIVATKKSPVDARVTVVMLTKKGKAIAEKLETQCADVAAAVDSVFDATGSQLWSELDVFEDELKEKSLYSRVVGIRKSREQGHVQVIAYQDKFKKAFKNLNIAWIEKRWPVEEADLKAVDRPVENIINKGGYIAVALYKNEPVGVCALIKLDDGGFELAKMAVSDVAKGFGIGTLLGEHCVATARAMGASRVYLESNTALVPAISLYKKLGFQRVTGNESPYERCNVQMELKL